MSKTFQSVPPCSSNKPQVARDTGEFGLKTKILVVFLVLLVTTHSLPAVFGAPDDPTSPNSQSSVLTNLREAAESRRDELLYLFEEEVPYEILSQLQGAISQMELASTLEDENQYQASQAYLEALKLFRESWESYSNYKPEAGEESLVTVLEDLTQEPQPQDIEEKIKDNKEKRIIKFQEKILQGIEEEESTDSETGDSVFETVKSGLQNIKKMLKEGSLAAAVEVLKITTNRYQDGVDEILAKEASKLDKSLTRMESKLERETEKSSNGRTKNLGDNEESDNNIGMSPTVQDTEKSNNGKGNDKDKTKNGNSRANEEQGTQPEIKEKSNNGNGDDAKDSDSNENEKSNNGKGNDPEVLGTSNDEEEQKEKSNNDKGNDAKESNSEDESQPDPVEEKTNNGNGNGSNDSGTVDSQEGSEEKSNNGKGNDPEEKSNNGNGNNVEESPEASGESQPETEKSNNGKGNDPEEKTNNGNGKDSQVPDETEKEPENDKTNNGKGNDSKTPEDDHEDESSKKDDKEKSNNGKKK